MSGKGGGWQSSPMSNVLSAMSMQMFRESNPTMKTLLGQTNEALQTGGIGAQIPMIQSAVTNAQSSLSGSMQSAKDAFAKIPGLSGSPVAQGQLSNMSMQGNEAISQIPTNMAMQFIGMGTQAAGGMMGQSTGAMGQAMQGQMYNQGWGNSMMGQLLGSLSGA